jgi:hypothetical protein
MPNLTQAQREALDILQSADVPLSAAQVARWWPTLGALPGSPPEVVAAHGRALAPLLGSGAPGKYSRSDRAAIELAMAGFPCPVLREVVLRVGGFKKLLADQPHTRRPLAEDERAYGVLVPDKDVERRSALITEHLSEQLITEAPPQVLTVLDTVNAAFMGKQLPNEEVADVAAVLGGDEALAVTFLALGQVIAEFWGLGSFAHRIVSLAKPAYLAALLQATVSLVGTEDLAGICTMAGWLSVSQVLGMVCVARAYGKEAGEAMADTTSQLREFLGHLLDSWPFEQPS